MEMIPLDPKKQYAPGLTQFGSDGKGTFRMEFSHGVIHEYTAGDPDAVIAALKAHPVPMAYWSSKIRGKYHFKVVM